MLQSQKLTSIEQFLIANKGKEISYDTTDTLYIRQKITQKNAKQIKEQYIGFEVLEGCKISNNIDGKVRPIVRIFYKIFHVNLYEKGVIQWFFWFNLELGILIETFLSIKNNEEFINSFLQFIDDEKETLTLKNGGSSQKYILDLAKSSKEKLGVTKFPLSFTIKKYLSEPVLIYEQILSLGDIYKIENIQIFQGNIVFTLQQIGEEKVDVRFDGKQVSINGEDIYFRDGTSFIKEYIELLFSYFTEHKTNRVLLKDLEKYYTELYKQGEIYENINLKKFTYENIRKSIDTKSQAISGINNLNSNFIGLDSKAIWCDYYIPE